MAEVLPINFPLPSESAVASYDYTDVAEGTGVTIFNLVGATGDNILTKETVYADKIEEEIAITDTTSEYVKVFDVDYDLSAFNMPKTIEGTGLVNFSQYGSGSGDETSCWYFTIVVKKYDGSTETTIGTVNSSTLSATGNHLTTNLELLPITLSKTHFAIGDILRVTVEGYIKYTGFLSGGPNKLKIGIGQDPMNRDGKYLTPSSDDEMITASKIYIPFKLDL